MLITTLSGWAVAGTAQAAGPASDISLSLSPASIVADGTSTTTATVNVIDGSVPPVGLTGEPVTLSSSDLGETIGPVTDDGNGIYTATITSSTTIGAPTITAADGAALSTTAALTQTAGPPADLTLALTPSSIVANGVSTTTATPTVTDAEHHVLSGQPVAFSSSDPGETIAASGSTATITSSTTVGAATITATDGAISGQATLTQTAGPPATVTVALNPKAIVADGASSSTATATVTDAEGHPLSGQPVTFISSDLAETIVASGSTATITSSTTVGAATITATDGAISGQATLTQTAGPPATVTVALNPKAIVANGKSTSTATATVTDAEGHLLSGQPVKVSSSDTGQTVGAVTSGSAGTYTATITSSKTVGTPTITATDGTVSGQATLTQTVGPAAKVAVKLKPTSLVADGTTTTTATATVTDAQGRLLTAQTVAFSSSDSGEKIGAIKNQGNGTYTAAITSSTTVAAPTITATDGTVSGRATLTQTPGPPAHITVQVSPGAIVADGTSLATATATVTDAQGHRVPTDTVTFTSSDPGQFFGPATNAGGGIYTAQIRSSTTIGTATITATDPAHVSGQATLTQAAGPSQMSLIATPASLVTNQATTLFAIVTSSSGSPTGTITFKRASTPIAGCVREPITPSGPTASCQTSFAASASPEQLTATFTPGPTSTAPTAVGATTVTVRPDLPTASLAVARSVEIGQHTIYSATVAPPARRPGPVKPSGIVGFFDNGQPIPSCQSQTLGGGTARCTVAYTAVGNHVISARYNGDTNFAKTTSAAQTISVVPVPVPVPVPDPVHVSGVVTSTMQWLFSFTPRYTRVLALIVKGVRAGASVHVTCHGGGCASARRIAGVSKTKRCGRNGKPTCHSTGGVNLAPAFKKRLHVGATITVLISHPGWIGKYYRFVIRAGRAPRIQIACLAPASTRPGAGCAT